jgi:hypothetical protein
MSQSLSGKSIMGTLKRNQTKDSSLAPESNVAARRDHLKSGVDYVIERRRVMITEAGYVALRGLLGCPESPDEEKAPPVSTGVRA